MFKKPNKMSNEATLAFIEHVISLKIEEEKKNKARNKTGEMNNLK